MDAAIQALTSEVAAARVDRKATKPKTVERRIAAAVEKALGRALKKAKAALAIEAGDLAEYAGIAPEFAGFVAFMTDVWTEVDRVLKPGGFVCGWALPKTADLAGLAMRAVGWELHESVLHLFGQGMCKAGDLGKKIDKMHGAEREDLGPAPHTRDGDVSGQAWTKTEHAPTSMSGSLGVNASRLTAPATEDAKRWTGWHSQVAPGHEQWLIARKPTRLTYARQLLEHGCGAFNVGACRIPRGEGVQASAGGIGGGGVYGESEMAYAKGDGYRLRTDGKGSHPRNVVLSPGGEGCPVEGLDRQSGVMPSSLRESRRPFGGGTCYGDYEGGERGSGHGGHDDAGGASRYFTRFDQKVKYCGKIKTRAVPFGGHNDHETPKSLDLMRWLVRLMAATSEHTGDRPAVVLDWCMGSGTTGVACVAEGVDFIGIEKIDKHFATSRAKILGAIGSPEMAEEANESTPKGGQMSLL